MSLQTALTIWLLRKTPLKVTVLVTQSCPTVCDPMDCSPRLLCPWDSPSENTGVGCHALLQGIFPTQGSNLRLLSLQHCRQIFTTEPPAKPIHLETVTTCHVVLEKALVSVGVIQRLFCFLSLKFKNSFFQLSAAASLRCSAQPCSSCGTWHV